VFTGMQSEEPIQTAGYICQFKNLEVKAVLLDEIMAAPESLERDWVLDIETKTLTDARELIAAGGLSAAYAAAAALSNRYVIQMFVYASIVYVCTRVCIEMYASVYMYVCIAYFSSNSRSMHVLLLYKVDADYMLCIISISLNTMYLQKHSHRGTITLIQTSFQTVQN
jgi:hypothetical protein